MPVPIRESLLVQLEQDDLSSHANRQLIGALGMVQPLLLWVIAGERPTQGLPRWNLLSSVSAYYYSGAVAVFVGILIALAVFLFTYRGYDNKDQRRDRTAACIAGGAAVLVAFFPTRPPCPGCVLPWWRPYMDVTHHVAATVLFLSFIYFSLVLFPKAGPHGTGAPSREKRRRNIIYRLCGVLMIGFVAWAFLASLRHRSIFWPEALALESFAVSWLVKGRFVATTMAIGRRTLGRVLHRS